MKPANSSIPIENNMFIWDFAYHFLLHFLCKSSLYYIFCFPLHFFFHTLIFLVFLSHISFAINLPDCEYSHYILQSPETQHICCNHSMLPRAQLCYHSK